MRREQNHPIRLAFKLNFKRKKEGRPSFTWKNSLEQDLNRYHGMEKRDWKLLVKEKDKIKAKAEEIFKEEKSEISDGISDDEDNSSKNYKQWKKWGR